MEEAQAFIDVGPSAARTGGADRSKQATSTENRVERDMEGPSTTSNRPMFFL